MSINTVSIDEIKCMVNLQLAGAAVSGDGRMSVRHIFSNIRRYSPAKDLEFSEFIAVLEETRDDYNIRSGNIGADVNYVSLKRN